MKIIEFKWPKGFKSGAVHAGFKDDNKLDMCWLVSDEPCAAAGVYTKNQFQAAPVIVTKQNINQNHELKAVVVNSGNANSFTGNQGMKNTHTEAQMVADQLGVAPDQIGVASTGIIGKQLQMDLIENGIDHLTLSDSTDAPEAIITTDTTSKKVCVETTIDGKAVTITGFAKGSGMIHPNMGTTLSFISTDANIDGETLQSILSDKIISSFNQITVDGCMSTNDMVITLANGAAQNEPLTTTHPDFAEFESAFNYVLTGLAKLVARDGEGSSKLIEADVFHAANQEDANHVARAIVGSNLIKAMIFGEDANWGRIVQALGQTEAKISLDHLAISIENTTIVEDSTIQNFDMDELRKQLGKDEVNITVDLAAGEYNGVAWGCDLTYKYVEINAAYEE
ncbi:bifunctional glutamate N-acetyltransferase/amino-acid acetyltransferase ArgJ [Lactobacillus sp. Sy-1]|uniref:bifunctional glutamate N-acetyltransferase/amino-acid acetyltransferase ArgJ n=1 Tax=Lactobacillus sp. Sy-1 TaxID=2109645 RepID=UPI001C58DE2F|nr:bifunctional glutamate N-acetyltransferase/amino-acid acetyltransferase ArgJ [Lactobacillus sp. Sy-1]MBW1605050.1 bifunctional glutamate N-acetyltransferase/amino-acid acetyltransferase ArgJ [Lactobacillus sp. Sy-1]